MASLKIAPESQEQIQKYQIPSKSTAASEHDDDWDLMIEEKEEFDASREHQAKLDTARLHFGDPLAVAELVETKDLIIRDLEDQLQGKNTDIVELTTLSRSLLDKQAVHIQTLKNQSDAMDNMSAELRQNEATIASSESQIAHLDETITNIQTKAEEQDRLALDMVHGVEESYSEAMTSLKADRDRKEKCLQLNKVFRQVLDAVSEAVQMLDIDASEPFLEGAEASKFTAEVDKYLARFEQTIGVLPDHEDLSKHTQLKIRAIRISNWFLVDSQMDCTQVASLSKYLIALCSAFKKKCQHELVKTIKTQGEYYQEIVGQDRLRADDRENHLRLGAALQCVADCLRELRIEDAFSPVNYDCPLIAHLESFISFLEEERELPPADTTESLAVLDTRFLNVTVAADNETFVYMDLEGPVKALITGCQKYTTERRKARLEDANSSKKAVVVKDEMIRKLTEELIAIQYLHTNENPQSAAVEDDHDNISARSGSVAPDSGSDHSDHSVVESLNSFEFPARKCSPTYTVPTVVPSVARPGPDVPRNFTRFLTPEDRIRLAAENVDMRAPASVPKRILSAALSLASKVPRALGLARPSPLGLMIPSPEDYAAYKEHMKQTTEPAPVSKPQGIAAIPKTTVYTRARTESEIRKIQNTKVEARLATGITRDTLYGPEDPLLDNLNDELALRAANKTEVNDCPMYCGGCDNCLYD